MEHYFDCSCYSSDTAGTIQLSECSIPFQDHFMEAWNAIESGDFSSFKRSISKMKAVAYHTLTPLDVYCVVEGSGMVYAMTLLALCGFHGRYDMVNSLVDEEGARIDSGCDTCGAPLFQMMLHCHAQNHPLKLDVNMVRLFIEKGTPLNWEIENHFKDAVTNVYSWSALDLPLTMNNIDLAKVLVEEGKIDPITGGCPRGEEFNVIPMFQEYCFHGTNEFISWVCNDHLPQHKRNEFTDRVLSCIESMKSHKYFKVWVFQRRTPAHAMLTCGHRETIELMVHKNKALLVDKNSTGKTALHMAAEEGDVCSVEVLLDLGADCKACDNSGMNPCMIAAEKGHLDVAKTILRRDSTVVSATVMKWALEKNLIAIFQCVHKEDLVTPIDDNGNTIVHLAAASGSTKVFKTLLDALWNEDGMNQLTVSLTNKKGRTPLQLAVEKGCIHILKVVQDNIERGRPGTHSLWQKGLQNDWRSKIIPPLLHLACSSGSLLAVKYFIENGYQPNISLKVAKSNERTDKTPIMCASEAGHDEIVEYLLQFSAVSCDPDCLKLPLLLAAANGHSKCTTLLLQKGASVLHTDENDKNCLVLAIENHHRTTALAILHDEKQGLNALNCVYNRSLTPLRLLIKEMPEIAEYALNRCIARKSRVQEQQRPADDFPDYDHPVAETKQSPRPQYQKQSSVTYDFRFLDDLSRRTEGQVIDVLPRVYRQVAAGGHQYNGHGTKHPSPSLINIARNEVIALEETDGSEVGGSAEATVPQRLKYDVENHVLKWMIRYKRLALLQHPLVKDFLFHKFWLLAYPLFLLYSVMYCILLILLTSFALVSPRPGPGSDTCPVPAMKTNGTDCPGQSGADRRFLTGAAILMIFLCSVMLTIEAVQFIERRRGCKYLKELENYFQITLHVLIIVFVAPGFANDCWCAHNWQWQIGALAVFLGWFNLIILLKDIPWTAIPINMFISICITFLKLIYLPLLLLVAFALPFYMIFARTSSALEEDGPGELVAFMSPSHSIAKTMVQIIGGIDFDTTFNEADLLYNPMTYILFIIFLVMMPVLFINLLIGLAVGDTSEEREKANFTKLQVRVDFILEQESNSKYLRKLCRKNQSEFFERDREIFNYEGCFGGQQHFFAKLFQLEYARHHNLVVQLSERNEAIYNDVMGVTEVEAANAALKQETSQLREDMEKIADGIRSLMESVKKLTEKMEGLAH